MKPVLLSILVSCSVVFVHPVLADAPAVKQVTITASDNMRFSVTHIGAHPGERIHIQLKNVGTLPKEVMGHNWILLKADADPAAYSTVASSAKEEGYIPRSLANKVICSIPLLGSSQTGDVEFDAPTTPGKYPFLCSFPGHFQVGMRGELEVK